MAINGSSFVGFNTLSLARCRGAPGDWNGAFISLLHVRILCRSAGPTCSNITLLLSPQDVPDAREPGMMVINLVCRAQRACALNVLVIRRPAGPWISSGFPGERIHIGGRIHGSLTRGNTVACCPGMLGFPKVWVHCLFLLLSC